MATFSQGIRVEYKRATATGTGSFQTVLQPPSSGNYLIFINQICAFGDSNNQIAIEQNRDNRSGVAGWQRNFLQNIDATNVTEYLDFFNNVGSASGAQNPGSPPTYFDSTQIEGFGAWAERILHPRKRLTYFGNSGSGQIEVYYQEVYFGGVFNY